MISASGKKWIFKDIDELSVLNIKQKFNVSDIIARILLCRNLDHLSAHSFLDPKIKDLLPDPSLLKDMDSAIDRVADAIRKNQKIVIYGDYDVDGATSVALLLKYFKKINANVDFYIPDRLDEGYGVNTEALEKIKGLGADLSIMVDCGTTSINEIDHSNKIGLDSIIIDHHAVGISIPNTIVVNPHRIDQEYVEHTKELCAAGLVFLFLVGLQRKLRNLEFLPIEELPNIMNLLDLVALGTVCDVMPLKGLNRAFVCRGLELMRKRNNIGISSIIDVAEVNNKISAYHLGFVIGPRINAAGRIGTSTIGARLLSTNDFLEAKEFAQKLNKLNEERQYIEKNILNEAINRIDEKKLYDNPVILIGDEKWHQGVIGIIASRLKEKYNRPAFVYSLADGEAKGSCRSVEGIDIGKVIHKSKTDGILSKGGGHSMAAGFSICESNIERFYDFLNESTQPFMNNYQPSINIDSEVSLSGVNNNLINEIESIEPFGVGNPTPKFCIRRIKTSFNRIVGNGHIQSKLSDEYGNKVDSILFRGENTDAGNLLKSGNNISIVGTIKRNDWMNNSTVQINIEDVSDCE